MSDIAADVLPRASKMSNVIKKESFKFIYRRYASFYFVAGIPDGIDKFIVLEHIHLVVKALDGKSIFSMIFTNNARLTPFIYFKMRHLTPFALYYYRVL